MFGGSFNPIHFGHLLLADEIAEALALDRVVFVPASQPPHKPAEDLAPASHRLEMTALATREHPRFDVSDLEIQRSGPSYTVDTLAAMQGRGALHLLIGSDTFLDLLNWREPWRVARLARLVVAPRHGSGFDPESPACRKVLRELELSSFVSPAACVGAAPVLVHAVSLPISGSELRRRAREGRSLVYRMPAAVERHIRDHGLYRA